MNHPHYFLEKQTAEIQDLAKKRKLIEPLFVGQGFIKHAGIYCEGGYIVEIRHIQNDNGKRLTLFGLKWATIKGSDPRDSRVKYCSFNFKSKLSDVDMIWIRKAGKNFYMCSEVDGSIYRDSLYLYSDIDWNGAYEYSPFKPKIREYEGIFKKLKIW